MKSSSSKIIAMLFAICMITAILSIPAKAQPGVSVSFQAFYDNLSPYGQWVQDPAYGYVWVPDMGPDFRPYYTRGHWVMSEYGNLWVSDYPWGWAPFHYGRWIYDAFYGWVWVPGNIWGPAWVSWRWGGGYCGWAPLRPGISFNIAIGNYYPPDDWWVFIPPAYIHHPRFYEYYRGPRNNITIIHNTTITKNTYVNNNVTYISGPRTTEIQQVTHQPVTVYHVRNDNKPGSTAIQNNTVNIYRPTVASAPASGARPVPGKVVKEDRPIGNPQPTNVNGGKPQRLNSIANGNSNVKDTRKATITKLDGKSAVRPIPHEPEKNQLDRETSPADKGPLQQQKIHHVQMDRQIQQRRQQEMDHPHQQKEEKPNN
jgi:hypothetical protein